MHSCAILYTPYDLTHSSPYLKTDTLLMIRDCTSTGDNARYIGDMYSFVLPSRPQPLFEIDELRVGAAVAKLPSSVVAS